MLGIWIGKLIAFALRLRGHQATSLPGKIALRISPRLINKLGRQLKRCVVVTGTNGKTTTTSFLSRMMSQEERIITNAQGANLSQGIATVMLQNATWLGHLRAETAVLEIDEATFPLLADCLPIELTIVTNVFRDQLDRYGELDTTLKKIIHGISLTKGSVLLNGDDPLARHIGLHTTNKVSYFGMSHETVGTQNRKQMRDGAFCLECGTELIYEQFIYGQLGFYYCPNCDFSHPYPEFLGTYLNGRLTFDRPALSGTSFLLPVRGLFNVYNALCAISAAHLLSLNETSIDRGIATFAVPTGRMQVFNTYPRSILNLIKNPTGCDSVLQAICTEPGLKVICIAINDLAADGRDVSWLWDSDFEFIAEVDDIAHCVTSGLRSEDMALRLKYAGYPTAQIEVSSTIQAAIDRSLELGQMYGNIPVYVLTTYTLLHLSADYLRKKVSHEVETVENRTSIS